MVERHRGEAPRTVTELEALPGIGAYTARSIASTAFGVPVTALDVNARRVVGWCWKASRPGRCRPDSSRSAPIGWRREDAAADWNHALMDLAQPSAALL